MIAVDPGFGRCLAVAMLVAFGACDAQARPAIWGYGFAGAGAAEIVSVVATSYEPDNVTPTSFQIYRNVDSTIEWGGANRPLAPFVTGGYSFGLDVQHGLDLGVGINYWLTERAGLRLDVRATRLTQNFRSAVWPDVSEWLVAFRGGLNFARRRF